MKKLNKIFPVRYTVMVLCILMLLLGIAALVMDASPWWWIAVFAGAMLTTLGISDLNQ